MRELVSIDCEGDTARLALRVQATSAANTHTSSACVLATTVAQLARQDGVRRIVISRHSHVVKR
ncbi:hypothetical protein D0911_16045 [Zhongshania marina]|uniref:Uncharacterized protein n=1 Tax=Zhongshania marina TaxID=2304603 RepID=A0ABX9W194_9GAMM|nr:hypothetical protein D0911_16045 [Zhongshania marina]